MKNQLPNEVDELVRKGVARLEVDSPALGSISYPTKRRIPVGKYVMAGAVAAVGAVGLSVFLLGSPSVTLAQVAEAQSKVKTCRMTYTRTVNGKKITTLVVAQDGKRWRSGEVVGDESQTVVPFRDREPNFAIVDGPRPSPIQDSMLEPEGLLKWRMRPKVERGLLVDGHRIDRFELKALYRNGRNEKVVQILDVDPKTRLPITHKIVHDLGRQVDQWDYDYSPMPATTFEMPALGGFRIFDERDFQKQLLATVRTHDSIVVVDQCRSVNIFIRSESYPEVYGAIEIFLNGHSFGKQVAANRWVWIKGKQFRVLKLENVNRETIASNPKNHDGAVKLEIRSDLTKLRAKPGAVPLIECGDFGVSFARRIPNLKFAQFEKSNLRKR